MASTIDVLAIKVQSDGITKASRELDSLGKSADTTEKKILKLIDTVNNMVKQFATSVSSTKAMTDALAVVNRTTQASDSAMKALTGSIAKLSGEVANLNARMQNGAAGITSHTVTIRHNTAAMTDAHAAARGLTGSLGALWLTYGNVAPLAAGAAIGASMKAIVTQGAEVENTLEAIRLKGEATIAEVADLRKAIIDIGQGIYGPVEVSKAFETLILAGLKAKDAINAIGAALNLATAGGTSIEKASEALVTIGTAVGATAQQYDYLADGITKAANISLASVDSIAEAVKRASVVNKLYGASFEDILTQTAALAQLGIKNTAAGTAITNFYANAQGSTEKAKKALDALGFSFQDVNGKAKAIVPAFEEFTQVLNKFDLASQKKIITDIFGERALRDVEAMRDLVNSAADDTITYANKLEEIQGQIGQAAGTSALVAAQQALTAQNQIKAVGNTLQGTFVEAFKSLEPSVVGISQKLKEVFGSQEFKTTVMSLANGFASLAKVLADNIPLITSIAEGFLAVGAATAGGAIFTRLIPVVSGLIAVMTGLATSFTAVGTSAQIGAAGISAVSAAAKFLPGIGIAIGLATAAWALYSTHTEKAKSSTDELAASSAALAKNYNGDFLKALEDEADRLDKVNAQLSKGVDLTNAQTNATKEQALAQGKLLNSQAVDAAQAALDKAQSTYNSGDRIKSVRDYTFDKNESAQYKELLKAQEALNLAKQRQAEFDTKAIKLAQDIVDKTKQQQEQLKINQTTKDFVALGQSGDKSFAGEDKSGKKALTFLQEEQRAIVTATEAYKAKTAAMLESYESGSKVAAESAESAVKVNKLMGKYASEEAYQSTLKLAREEDLAKVNYDKAKQYTELGIKLKGIVEGEKAYQAAVAQGEDGGAKYTREAEALSKFLGLTKEQTTDFINLAKASDEINKTLDTRKKLESGAASATARAEQLMEQAKAMSEYGSKAKSTALDLAKAKVAEMDLNDAATRTIANNYLKAASYETVAKALVNITRIGEQAAEEEIKASADSLLMFADSEKKKIEIKADASKKIIAMNLEQARIAAQSGDDKAVKAYEKAYEESVKAIAQIDKTTKTKMHNVELEDWKKTVNMIVDTGLEGFDHIFDKGTSIWKSLTNSIKDMFKKTVIDYIKKEFAKPFLLNIVSSVTGSLGMTGLADTAKALLGGEKSSMGASGAVSAVSGAANLYKIVSGGFEGISAGVAKAVQGGLDKLGLSMSSGAPGTLATAAGSLATIAAGVSAGLFGGKLLSGGYGSNSAVNAGTGIGGIAGAVVGGPIGAAIGSALGGLIGGIGNRLFGMGSKNVTAQGIRGSITDSGATGEGYASWTQKGGLFRSNKSGTDIASLSADITNTLASGFTSLKMASEGFAKSIGLGTDTLNGFTKSFDIAFGSDATKNQEAVTKFFTDLGDELATKLVPNIKDFSLQGETASVTLERLSNIFGATNQVAEILGKSVEQMFGGKGLDTAKARENLVNLAGGINELANKTTAYVTAIYSDSQKLEPVQKALAAAFTELNVTMPTTKEGFKALVDSLNLTDSAQAKLFNSLLDLAPAFAQITDATQGLADAQKEAAEEAQKLQEDMAKRQLDLLSKRLALELQVATLEGNTVGMYHIVNEQRRLELEAMDASLRPWQERIYLLQDEAAANEKAAKTAKDAFDKSVENAESAYSKLSAAITKQKDAINKSYDFAVSAEKKRADLEINAAKDRLKIAEDNVKAIEDVFSAINKAIESTKIESDAINRSRRTAAQSLIRNAAQSGADVTKIPGLNEALEDVSKSSEQYFSTFEEFAMDQAETKNNLDALKTNAQTQLDFAKLTVDRLNSTIESIEKASAANLEALALTRDADLLALDQTLEMYRNQIDILKGIDVSVLSVAEAIKGLRGALSSIGSPTPSAGVIAGTAKPTTIGSGASVTDTIKAYYQNFLGREAEQAGLDFWVNKAQSGWSMVDIAKGFASSDEYKKLHSFAVGTNYIPNDMMAMVHEGERIVPAADNAELMRRLDNDSGGMSQAEIVAAIKELQEYVCAGDLSIATKLSDLNRIVKKWDNEGLPEERDVAI